MANYNLTPGISLDSRFLTSTIPDGTTVSGFKVIAKSSVNNYIAEDYASGTTRGYVHYIDEDNNEVTAVFYEYNGSTTVVNASSFQVYSGFGVITEVDDTATLYQYLTRLSNEKVYVVSEDFSREESLNKSQIETEIEARVLGYGVPVGSVFGYDNEGQPIPAGFEEILIDDDDMRY